MEKIVAIADSLIDRHAMLSGLEEVSQFHQLEVLTWYHETIADLQADNRQIEEQGPNESQLPSHLLSQMAKASVLIVQYAPVSRGLIEVANLKAIFVLRAGLENVDQEAAAEHGVEVINLVGRNARAVAEFTVGLMLAETKNIARSHAELMAGYWKKGFVNQGQVIEFKDKVVGLIGFGQIGSLIADLLSGFGVKLLVYDPYLPRIAVPKAELVSFNQLLRESDIVSLHARVTPETHHLMNEKAFDIMKPTAYFINSARAHLVDESALIAALKNQQLMGAALDVFEDEPLGEEHPLLALTNVTLTAHMAGTTVDAFSGSPKLMLPKIQKWLLDQEIKRNL